MEWSGKGDSWKFKVRFTSTFWGSVYQWRLPIYIETVFYLKLIIDWIHGKLSNSENLEMSAIKLLRLDLQVFEVMSMMLAYSLSNSFEIHKSIHGNHLASQPTPLKAFISAFRLMFLSGVGCSTCSGVKRILILSIESQSSEERRLKTGNSVAENLIKFVFNFEFI